MLSRKILAAFVTIGMILGPLVASAAAIAGLVQLFKGSNSWSLLHWGTLLPFLYLGWVYVFLQISALLFRELGRRWPKPRRVVFGQGVSMETKDVRGLMTVGSCYQGFNVVHGLPLARVFGPLVMRAYSPSIHLGRWVRNWGYLYDPDLIDVGDRVTIGGRTLVVAHTVTVRPDGASVYVSARIAIRNRATIGGDALVTLGCVIGEDAVVEPGSVVAPFTQIPAGEVWGGNPAVYRRKRDELTEPASQPFPAPAAGTGPDQGRAVTGGAGAGSATEADAVRRLVIDALDLSPGAVPEDLSSETCASWDSLGQVSIAAAIYDRHGITVGPEEVFRLRTLGDVANAIGGVGRPAASAIEEPPAAPSHAGRSIAVPVKATPNAQTASTLPRDVEMLPLLDPQEVSRALAMRLDEGQAAPAARLPVLIAATFTVEPIGPPLKLWGRTFGLDVDCRFAGYDQIVQTLLGGDRSIEGERPGATIVLARPEDLASESMDSAMARIEQMLEAVKVASNQPGRGRLLVGTLPPLVSSFALHDRQQVEALRERYRSGLLAVSGIEIFDFAEVVERLGVDQARHSHSEVLTRAPYSPLLFQRLAIALVRQIRSTLRSPAKVIALDCDNTLWGGVVGEVGMEGIVLGSDGAGRSFQLFQRYLKRLKERGLLLVVVSKNEEHDVRNVFARHPEMVLGTDDIAAWRVNWRHKSENLRELAAELNLGLDSFVLLDDDPATRLEVETRLPDVHVVPMPVEPEEYCATLSRLWLFDGARPTAVDTARTQMMQDEQRRQQARSSTATLDDFLVSLELRVNMTVAAEHDLPRVAQLTQRTNQFNLSLKRRTLDALKSIDSQSVVLVLEAADRFGDYGLVGVCILTPARDRSSEIDTLLMSCRALGRGVEDAFLHGIATVASENGSVQLVAPYVEGPRNGQIKDFLARSGFEEQRAQVWMRSLNPAPPPVPHVMFRVTRGRQLPEMFAAPNDASDTHEASPRS